MLCEHKNNVCIPVPDDDVYHISRNTEFAPNFLLVGPIPIGIPTELDKFFDGRENLSPFGIVENIFEEVRASRFPDKLSRHRALFAIGCEDCAKEYTNYPAISRYLYKVRMGKIHAANVLDLSLRDDAVRIVMATEDERERTGATKELACLYWGEKTSSHPKPEILIHGNGNRTYVYQEIDNSWQNTY